MRAVKHGLSLDVIMLIAGIMIFKEIMEASGAVKNLSEFLRVKGIPCCSAAFSASVCERPAYRPDSRICREHIPADIEHCGRIICRNNLFAFASGFSGVLLSPVHICLVLTREYFKADMWGVYKKIIPAASVVFLVAVAEYLILR